MNEPFTDEHFAASDAEALYARMRPDQRTAIANEFIRVLELANDPGAHRLPIQRPHDATQEGTTGDTAILPISRPSEIKPPEQVAALHRHTLEHHPDLFAEVQQHPVTVASLASPGVEMEVNDEAGANLSKLVVAPKLSATNSANPLTP